MSEYDDLDTAEKCRARIESAFRGRIKEREKIAALMRPLMKKEDVVAAVQTVVSEEPVEKEGVLWIGDCFFTFDHENRLKTGPNWSSSRRQYTVRR